MYRTRNLIAVAAALLEQPRDRHWVYDLAKRAGVRSGALYRMLTNMLDEGWVTDGWEPQEAAVAAGRPPRRYYELTEKGLAELGAVLRAEHARSRKPTRERFA